MTLRYQAAESRMPATESRVAFCLFAVLFSIYLLTFSGIYHSSDEKAMLVATDSLARRGAWDIDLLRWMGEQQGSFGPDGHLYSRKGIGTTLAALPLYWLALQSSHLGNVQTAMLTNAFVTALTGAVLFLLVRRLGYSRGVALGTALAFGLGTMAWPYARYLFSESLAGLGLVLSAYGLVCLDMVSPLPEGYLSAKLPKSASPGGSIAAPRFAPLLAGAGLGLALLARLNNAIVAPFLGLLLLIYLYRRHRRHWRAWIQPLVLFALPIVVALAVTAWYNWLRFSSPWTTGYLSEERFATPFFEGLYGLTFSPGKGLFWYNPLLFAAVAAWPAFFRHRRKVALLAAAVVVANLAFYAGWYLWWAGHSWGPRFLVAALPFAVLPLAPALEAATRRRAAAFGLGLLAVVSLGVQLLGVAVDPNAYLDDIYAQLGLYARPTLFDPVYSPLLRQFGYLRAGHLDLAWARGGALQAWPLITGAGLLALSGLAMASAWRGRLRAGTAVILVAVLVLGALSSLVRYAPTGDVATAAGELAAMEEPGEAAALTDSLLTDAFQDAYDGRLLLWGSPQPVQVGNDRTAVWSVGTGEAGPAQARFQVGTIRLDYEASGAQPFPIDRAPGSLTLVAHLGEDLEVYVAPLAVSIAPAIEPGATIPLTLYWRVLAPLDRSYTVFVQAIDEAGVKAGQVDSLPCNGACSTTTWQPGDLIGQWYDLPIEPNAPPGEYAIIAGMYDLSTGERLPVTDAHGQPTGTYLVLGRLQVEP